MDEECADFCGVHGGIEKFRFADVGMVAAEKGFAFAPTAAGGNDGLAFQSLRFNHKIGFVFDELAIEAEDRAEGTFDLGWRIVARLEYTDGGFDQGVENRSVGVSGEAYVEGGEHWMMIRRRKNGLATQSRTGLSPATEASGRGPLQKAGPTGGIITRRRRRRSSLGGSGV